jgi:hypothetical protein
VLDLSMKSPIPAALASITKVSNSSSVTAGSSGSGVAAAFGAGPGRHELQTA